METVKLEMLTDEQKRELMNQIEAETAAKEQKKREDREAYAKLREEVVVDTFGMLLQAEEALRETKRRIFNDFVVIIDMKQALFNISDEQMEKQGSHTFTAGNKTVQLGQNIIDGWDDDIASAGVAKVNDWLSSKENDDNRALVGMVRDLLKPSKDGVLKASRVLELTKKAKEIGDVELMEAVDMLRDAYRPKKTSSFVRAKYRNDQGEDVWLNLSM